MSNDRDTHFTGFAQALFEELEHNTFTEDDTYKGGWTKIVARRTYDLAMHVIGSLNSYLYDVSVDDTKLINYVEDMPALPKVEE